MSRESSNALSPTGSWNNAESSPPTRAGAISTAGKQHADRETVDSGPTSRSTVAVACTGCRSRHLKCDGQTPCSRCKTENINCSYVKSRRGWKGPRMKASPQAYGGGLISSAPGSAPIMTLSPQIDTSVLDTSNITTETLAVSPDGRFSLDFLGAQGQDNRGQLMLLPPPPAQLPVDTSHAGLVNAFYTFFYPAHPFVLPRNQLLEHLQKTRCHHLEIALQYIGSFYVIGGLPGAFEQMLQGLLQQHTGPKDTFFVQSMLLLAIGLHMADREEDSANVMYHTIETAQQLRIHERSYSMMHATPGSLMEECIRRTWWEIFVCDGMFAGVNPVYKICLSGLQSDVPFPVEDEEYINGHIVSVPKTADDYEENFFLQDETVFSSATYRIDAVRVVHRVLAATRTLPVDTSAVDLADTHLANWGLHLPDCKKKIIDRDGKVDEVLFEAHMIIAACSILLHRPRSELSHEDVKDVTTCIAGGPMDSTASYTDMHTAKAMRAAMDICVLIKMPCPLAKHSPFFTCAITMAAVVYLSYWSFIATDKGDNLIKEHIRLNIGSLKTLSSVMPIAKTVLKQVKGVAQELFQSRKALSNALFYSPTTREEIIQGMIEEVPHGTVAALPAPTLPTSWDLA